MSVGLSKVAPELLTLSIPFLFNNYREVDCVFIQVWPLVERILAEKGYIVLGYTDVGFSVLFSKKNLRTAEDFKKVKFWQWTGLEIDKAMARLYEIQILIPLSLPDVLSSLSTGMVDTVYATYYTAVALQWHTQIKYMSDTGTFGGAYAPGMLLVKKSFFESLPPEIRKAVRDGFTGLFRPLRERTRVDEEKAKESLLKRGIKIMDIDPETVINARARSQSLFSYRDFGSSPWFFQSLLRARDQCRGNE